MPWWKGALWVAGPVVATIGVVVFLVAHYRNPSAGDKPLPPTPARAAANQPNQAALSRDARLVAGKFILTAVARKNTGASWAITHPTLKAGYTKREWAATDAELPIVPFPVSSIDEARFQVTESFPNSLLLEVALIPKDGSEVPATLFHLGMRRVGAGAERHWLVDYWMPRYVPPVRDNPVR